MPRRSAEGRMSVLDHLEELRSRLFRSILVLLFASAAAFFLSDRVFHLLIQPYCDLPAKLRPAMAGGACKLYFTGVVDPFLVRIKVTLYVGAAIAMPFILFQTWRFITPGLHPKERRYAIPFVISSMALFALGVWFAFLTLRPALQFLVGFAGKDIVPLLTVDRYLKFIMGMILAFGLTFEFPLVLVFLSIAGVLTSAKMIRAWRVAVFLIFLVAAVVTPSQDPYSLTLMAVPMLIFYVAAILVARFMVEPARRRRMAPDQGGSTDGDQG